MNGEYYFRPDCFENEDNLRQKYVFFSIFTKIRRTRIFLIFLNPDGSVCHSEGWRLCVVFLKALRFCFVLCFKGQSFPFGIFWSLELSSSISGFDGSTLFVHFKVRRLHFPFLILGASVSNYSRNTTPSATLPPHRLYPPLFHPITSIRHHQTFSNLFSTKKTALHIYCVVIVPQEEVGSYAVDCERQLVAS